MIDILLKKKLKLNFIFKKKKKKNDARRMSYKSLPHYEHHVATKRLSFYLFIYLFKFILFIFSCVGSLLLHVGFSLRWLLLLRSTGSTCMGFSSCGVWA